MNRPTKENYKCLLTYTIKAKFAVGNYVEDLEKYCDELEKAFDRACEELSAMITCEQDKSTNEIVRMRMLNKEQWKERLLNGRVL